MIQYIRILDSIRTLSSVPSWSSLADSTLPWRSLISSPSAWWLLPPQGCLVRQWLAVSNVFGFRMIWLLQRYISLQYFLWAVEVGVLTSWFGFHWQPWSLKQECVVTTHIQLPEFTTSGPQERWRNISEMIVRNEKSLQTSSSSSRIKSLRYLCNILVFSTH